MVNKNRRRDLKRRYGITPGDYDLLLAVQGGVCAICARHPRTQNLAVDHSHRTGQIRGLLCSTCNRHLEFVVGAHQRVRRDCTCPHCQYWNFPPAETATI